MVITSGGTIDAVAYRGQAPVKITPLRKSIIPAALEIIGLSQECEIYKWHGVDSKDITGMHLLALAAYIKEHGYRKVVITMGTDKMVENARFLKSHHKEAGDDVTIVFTGAMVPIMNQVTGYGESDGYDNLKLAVLKAGTLKPGVYIAFHEQVFDPDSTYKNFEKKRFEMLVEAIEKAIS